MHFVYKIMMMLGVGCLHLAVVEVSSYLGGVFLFVLPSLSSDDNKGNHEGDDRHSSNGSSDDSSRTSTVTARVRLSSGSSSSKFGFKPELGVRTFNIESLQSIIADSTYYSDAADFTAEIKFCVRVDSNTVDESVNFHETDVTLTVDLTAGFQLTGIAAERSAAMQRRVDQEEEDSAKVTASADLDSKIEV